MENVQPTPGSGSQLDDPGDGPELRLPGARGQEVVVVHAVWLRGGLDCVGVLSMDDQ